MHSKMFILDAFIDMTFSECVSSFFFLAIWCCFWYKNFVIVAVTLHSIGDNVHVTGIFVLVTFHFQWWLWWVLRTQRHYVVYWFICYSSQTEQSSKRAKHEIPSRFITKLLHYSWHRCQIERYWYGKFNVWMRKKHPLEIEMEWLHRLQQSIKRWRKNCVEIANKSKPIEIPKMALLFYRCHFDEIWM